ncbi:hypothetical protein TSUD_273940 [Trifolium subterraneum]|uniref:BZIP domain-containing protein n=1 Tax=Trifolium subterraneum TaxID=3900 RepID=A0A2Z6N6P7_TRISU|nr:hypothetical protein TSUD_273940 [Trifolium subterraneum]
MASQRIGEIGLSEGPSSQHVPYGVLHGITNSTSTLMNQGSAFDFGELEEAIVLQGIKIRNDEGKTPALFTSKPAATLEMFPSWPIRFQQTPRVVASLTSPSLTIPYGGSKSGGESTDSGSTELQFDTDSPLSVKASSSDHHNNHNHNHAFDQQLQQQETGTDDGLRTDTSQNQSKAKSHQEKKKGAISTSEKTLDPKTLRRLAQNREAAKKSRLRKKAYVQQLETSRLRLSNLEQDLQRARSQGQFLGCGGGNISPGAAMFDMEYARWLEEDQRHLAELRAGLHATLPDNELKVIVDGYLYHYDELFRLKGVAVKSDVFHLIKGIWASPAERPFIWIEQQIAGIMDLGQSAFQAEEALSKGHEQLHHAIVDTIAGGAVIDG